NVQRTLQFFNVAQRFPYAGIEQLRVVKVQIARSFPGHLTFACTLGQASQRTCGCSLFRTKGSAWPFVRSYRRILPAPGRMGCATYKWKLSSPAFLPIVLKAIVEMRA